MQWMAVLLLCLALFSYAEADETPVEDTAQQRQAKVYEEALLRFNTHIKHFSSWNAFQAEITPMIAADASGYCYTLTGAAREPVKVSRVKMQWAEGGRWRKTSGGGWRHMNKDRTFIEYRMNEQTSTLLWAEGVKPRFFFAHTERICELSLLAKR